MKTFSWKGIDLNLLVAFQALYRARSVSKAADLCYVSQSAMSHTLQRMRGLFDDRLFERVGTQMEPTKRAHDLAPMIDTLLESVKNNLLIKPEFEPSQYKGVCRIGLTDYAEQLFAPAIYDEIKRHAPLSQVSFFNVNRNNYVDIVEREGIDLVIGSIQALDPSFLSEHLYTEEHLCLFDPNAVRFSNPPTLNEFVSVEHALVSPDGSLQTHVDEKLEVLGYKRRVGVASRNFLTIRRLLLGRELVCIVPKRFAEHETHTHSLETVLPPVEVADFDIKLLYPKTTQHDPKSLWLREIIQHVVK